MPQEIILKEAAQKGMKINVRSGCFQACEFHVNAK
jgi:hypothetical protein